MALALVAALACARPRPGREAADAGHALKGGEAVPPPWVVRDRSRPLSAAAQQQIITRFREQVPTFFGDRLRYAFVCGSVARGQARAEHDIDTVVILRRPAAAETRAFVAWLAALHDQMGMQVDAAYPAEVMTEEALEAALAGIGRVRLSLDFNPSSVFDQITWAEMIAAERAGEVGDVAALRARAAALAPAVERVRRRLLEDLADGAGHAHLAQAYFARQRPPGPPPGLAALSLPRLMTRLVPLPEAPPPPGTSALGEAVRVGPPLLTARLELRPLVPEDARWLRAWAAAGGPPPPWAPAPWGPAAAEGWLEARAEEAATGTARTYLMAAREGGGALGLARLATGPRPGGARAAAWLAAADDAGLADEAAGRLEGLAARLSEAP